MKERVIPFLNYRYFAYALSGGMFIIFTIITAMQGGLKMGVDFVGGQKIIAKFEKGVDEDKIRRALTTFNPSVQKVGEPELNEYIIATKLSSDSSSAIQEKIIDQTTASFPGIKLLKDRAVIVSFGTAVDRGMLETKLAGMDAVIMNLGDAGKNMIVIYQKEAQGKKKSSYNSDTIINIVRSSFEKVDIMNSVALMALFDKPVDEAKFNAFQKKNGLESIKTDYRGNKAVLLYRIIFDESDRIKAALAKNFKQAEVRSVESVGPAVGEFLKKSAVKLIIVSILLMTIYLSWRFEFRYSVGAMVAVLHDVVLALMFCGVAGVEINIPVIAALLTIFGYSVNDTIVIFDRIRENTQIESKSSFIDIVNQSVTYTMSRTILTSYLTLLTVFALFFLGGEGIADFAMVLLFGMVVGVYSTVYIASPVVISWENLMAKFRSR